MNGTTSPTLLLASKELQRFGFQARFKLETYLPSFEIRIENRLIVIAAPDEIEYLYGIYEYAERFCGWDFFEPGKDVLHPENILPLPPDGIAVPAKKKRISRCGFIQEFPFDHHAGAIFDWMAKNKLNYLMVWMEYYDSLSDQMKQFAAARGITVESGHHNFKYLIPREKYGMEHPEYFARDAVAGEQLAGMPAHSDQLCTTNAELRRELIKNLLEYRKKHPEVHFIGLNPNDGFGWCNCPECSKLYDPQDYGASYCRSEKHYRAGKIFHQLITAVSTGLHEADPEAVLNFFAYVNYSTPAPGFKLLPGMSVHLALYWRCINHDINAPDCGINSGYYQDILAWEHAKAGGFFNIYEYYQGINFYLGMPMLHFEAMFREFDFYAEHHVDGVLTQFSPQHWSAYGINYFLMAQAARGNDCEKALQKFFSNRFGTMADTAANFYRKLKKIIDNIGSCHIPHLIAFLSRVDAEALQELLPEAESLSTGVPLLPGKALAVWVEYMIRFKELYDRSRSRKTTAGDVKKFLQWIHGQQESKLFVDKNFDHFFKSWFSDIAAGKDWRYFTENDWNEEYLRHPVIPH